MELNFKNSSKINLKKFKNTGKITKGIITTKKHRHKWTYGGDCPCCGCQWEECIANDDIYCEKVKVNGKILEP